MLSSSTGSREPAINMPGILTAFLLLLLGIHGVREFVPVQTDARLVLDYGFVPARWSVVSGYASPEEVVRQGDRDDGTDGEESSLRGAVAAYVSARTSSALPSFLTYSLLHGSWMHVVLNCIWLAAFGTPVVRRCGPLRSAALAVATSIGGALAYWLASPLGPFPMVGASGIVSGFMGAAAVFVFGEGAAAATEPEGPRRIGFAVGQLLRNRSALFFLGSWLVVNVLTGVFAAPLGIAAGGIAWQAHIGGLLTGLLMFPLLDPVRRSRRRTFGA